MQLENQFVVGAPLEQTWSTLLDIRRVAQCLPGAELDSDIGDGVHRGSMQVRLGPMSLKYKGSARLADVDEDAHVATIEVQAKEQRGQGTASARIRNQVRPHQGGMTEVTVRTDLNITGRPAQFGRGIMEDVAAKMLEDFAKRLEGQVLASNGGAPSAGGESSPAAPASVEARPPSKAPEAALDLGPILVGPIGKRAAVAGGSLLVAVLVVDALSRGRRRGLSVSIRWR